MSAANQRGWGTAGLSPFAEHGRIVACALACGSLLALAATLAHGQTATTDSGPAAAGQPAAREAMNRGDITAILGRQVWDEDGQLVGRIVDVLVDGAGSCRAAVVDAGGFMGLGQRRVAIAWSALHFTPGSEKITLDLKEGQVAAMPEYKPAGTGPVVVAQPKTAAPEAAATPAPAGK